MMKRILLAVFLFGTGTALAHPGVGIVIDSRGNVYYTDLEQVWKIDAAGRKTIAVPNVHTHELAVDAADNLYGEHLWYEGERINKWGHRVWRRSPDGRVVNVIPPREGYRLEYSFVRDRAGTMYWADRGRSEIRKRAGTGPIVTIAHGQFREIRWMNVTPDGVVYLVDWHDLVRVDGGIRTIVRDLATTNMLRPDLGGRHVLFGIWFDRPGNIYVADFAHREVKRVTSQGRVSVAATSTFPWGPTGGVFAPNGDLWLLEYSIENRARARRIPAH